MKYFFLTLALLISHFLSFSQETSLDVEGSAKIKGELSLGQFADSTSVMIGMQTGVSKTGGKQGTFTGYRSGANFISGNDNSFYGANSGELLLNGNFNTFYGSDAGGRLVMGDYNSSIGYEAGQKFTDGNENTFLGSKADTQLGATDYIEGATAIGFAARVGCSHCMVLGGTGNSAVNVGIGESKPAYKLSLGSSLARTKLALYQSGSSNYGLGVEAGAMNFNLGNSSARYAFYDSPGSAAKEVFTINGNGSLTVLGNIVHSSDVNRKENILPVATDQLLQSVLNLPIYSWQFKGIDGTHIGPMAQDFSSVFGLGNDDKTISVIDAQGIALAAIQALHQENQQLKSELETQKRLIEQLMTRLEKLE